MADKEHRDRPAKRARKSHDEPELVLSLRRLDPILQFLTKATGKPTVPLATLRAALPGQSHDLLLVHIPELSHRGVLRMEGGSQLTSWNDAVHVGFPPPPSLEDSAAVTQQQSKSGTLHGSTKTAAKRRLAALRKNLTHRPEMGGESSTDCTQSASIPTSKGPVTLVPEEVTPDAKTQKSDPTRQTDTVNQKDNEECMSKEEQEARNALDSLFHFVPLANRNDTPHCQAKEIAYPLPKQASFAGSNPGRVVAYGEFSEHVRAKIAPSLSDAFCLERPGSAATNKRRLYKHQADAINSAVDNIHTIVCTGTGSGKSLCFLLPVLSAAMQNDGSTSIVMFPTKALAQDQMTKLLSLLQAYPELEHCIHPGIIDGDTSHAQRGHVAKHCNLILTNPDTLHAAILPGWKKVYRPVLQNLRYVVIDEAHIYEGIFGAHVAMVLSRLQRLCMVCSLKNDGSLLLPTFLACSATMPHPEHHFRLLCPIPSTATVKVVSTVDDGSPCAPKHFFVWNPPIMNINGESTGRLTLPRRKRSDDNEHAEVDDVAATISTPQDNGISINDGGLDQEMLGACADFDAKPRVRGAGAKSNSVPKGVKTFRRHAADETALLLAKAVANNVRCIVFCKTRCLVEWVYERSIAALRSNPATERLCARVESYRGGYSAEARRLIEQKLFQNELTGVVGTSALELGVDIGGIDLTLHCGYPTSHSSLLQQAGRAGRGGALGAPSVAVMVCFNSPCEQHIWRHPTSLLSRGVDVPPSIPLNVGLLQGHMLCAGEEFPLAGEHSVCAVVQTGGSLMANDAILSDFDLFGSETVYVESIEGLSSKNSLVKESVASPSIGQAKLTIFKTHPSICKPWSKVSLRSIEPINYSIVDISLQGGRMDCIRDEAVMDTIPYSRVFYHAFPGAVITHRGKKYEVQCMTRPPPFTSACNGYRGSCSLGAFAKPTRARYLTRPLSKMHITVVKQMERVDSTSLLNVPCNLEKASNETASAHGSLAGNGVVTVKREVHGYKKLSPVTRVELSRSEISLPPMEFDTYAIWIDADASVLSSQVFDYDDGVHALSHALLAVAPLFVSCTSSDIDCDHSAFGCTRVVLFDVRAGGAGTCAQLWKYLFMPDGLLSAAIDLLETCPSCDADRRHSGGCPACIQSGHCLKFNQQLSRRSGLIIGKHMLERIEQTHLYQSNVSNKSHKNSEPNQQCSSPWRTTFAEASSPRRKARAQALHQSKDLQSARERQIVVGRPSWPLDDEGRT